MSRRKDAEIVNITETRARRLEPRKQEFTVWDETVTGFGVRVLPSGKKSYIYWARVARKKQRKIKIGRVGTISADHARKVATGFAAELARGCDPAAERRKQYNSPTLRDLCEKYIASLEGVSAKDTTWRYRATLVKHVYPKIGKMLAKEVTQEVVETIRRDLEHKKTTFNQVKKILSAAYNMAIRAMELNFNPARHVKLYKTSPRKRFLSSEEIRRLALAIDSGVISPVMVAAIRVLILTGARPGEILKLKWGNVNLEAGAITLPESKSGPKNIRIGPIVADVLSEIEPVENNPYVFASPTKPGRPIASIYLAFQKLCETAGIREASPYTLRKTFASKALQNGIPLAWVAQFLGHKDQRTTETFYAFLGRDQISEAADTVSSAIADLMNGENGDNNGKVPTIDERVASIAAAMIRAGIPRDRAVAAAREAINLSPPE